MTANTLSRYYLAASLISGIGPAIVHKLLNRFPSLVDVFQANSQTLQSFGLSKSQAIAICSFDWGRLDKIYQWALGSDCHVVTLADPSYPDRLKHIAYPPLALFVKGDVKLLSLPQIAIVGSRSPTMIGYENAGFFASQLVKSGFVVTSGLARGIDGAAHQGALANNGKTIAVLGTGINRLYPRQNKDLATSIINQGTLVSEFPLDTAPLACNFPRRNRIITGLSLGVLVVEAASKSGSLISARFAMEQGREVFAIPGSIHNPLAKGCHQLIQSGAKLVESIDDILQELCGLMTEITHCNHVRFENQPKIKLTLKQQKLLSCIDDSVTSFDIIMLRSGFARDLLLSMLLELEIQGLIVNIMGGYCRKLVKI